MPGSEPAPIAVQGQHTGDNGARLYYGKHEDIDYCTVEVFCRQGSCRVFFQERVGWSWATVANVNLSGPDGHFHRREQADDSWCDADFEVFVDATANGTSADITFANH